MDYEEYEKECDKMRKLNEAYLSLFEADLRASGLKDKTIDRHLSNVDFYINEFLLREDIETMQDGAYHLDSFLGYFFIRKCMWSTPNSIKTTAASLKKFYKSMLAHGKIQQEDYDSLCEDIKENMDQWCADCAQYNDPYADIPFDFFGF